MPEYLTQIVCYEVWSGDGSGSYDESLMYNDWDEAAADIKAAIHRGRDVLLKRLLLTQAEFDEPGNAPEADVRRFRGDPPVSANAVREDVR